VDRGTVPVHGGLTTTLWCMDPRRGGTGSKRRMRGSLPRAALGGG
jgi:hypothetical protein